MSLESAVQMIFRLSIWLSGITKDYQRLFDDLAFDVLVGIVEAQVGEVHVVIDV